MQIMIFGPKAATAVAAEKRPTIAIEAEWGELEVVGSLLALNHHGERAGNPAPCTFTQEDVWDMVDRVPENTTVILSHVDLDTLGGVLAVIGSPAKSRFGTAFERSFWSLAGDVDVNGAHKVEVLLQDYPESERERLLDTLHAFWAWSDKHRLFGPRTNPDTGDEDPPVDALPWVKEAQAVIETLLSGGSSPAQERLLEAGRERKEAGKKLNGDSFLDCLECGLVIRSSGSFVNHIYNRPGEEAPQKACLNWSPNGAVTLSFADPIPGKSVRRLLQEVFTDKGPDGKPLAGGSDGIGGSPRNRRATWEEVQALVCLVRAALR